MKQILLSFVILMLAGATAWAAAKDGEATVTEGYTTTVQIGAAYQRTLSKATGINYQWSSANTSYFTVQSSNKNQATIKGIKPTSSPVRLNYHCSYYLDGYYRTMDFYYDITVKSATVSVTNIVLNETEINLKTGETYQLTATVYPTNATNRNVNWTTSSYAIAGVSDNGLITANGIGTATIYCTAKDGSGVQRYCTVTVTEAAAGIEDMNIDRDDATLEIYNLQGILQYLGIDINEANLSTGVYIVKTKSKTYKIKI